MARTKKTERGRASGMVNRELIKREQPSEVEVSLLSLYAEESPVSLVEEVCSLFFTSFPQNKKHTILYPLLMRTRTYGFFSKPVVQIFLKLLFCLFVFFTKHKKKNCRDSKLSQIIFF